MIRTVLGDITKMENRMYEAVIFDFDYTLGDSTGGIERSINYALGRLGCGTRTTQEIRKTIGLSLKNTYIALTDREDETEAAMFSSYFKEKADEVMVEHTQMYAPAKELLLRLQDSACKVGIVTTKFHYRIDQILSKFAMNTTVDLIVGSDDVKVEKPCPEGLLWAIEHLAVDKAKVLYVGDSLVDAQTAERAGVDFAGVLTGTTTREDFEKYQPVRIAEDLYGIYELIF